MPPSVLSIGGTDPCGAFGLLADLKTFAAHGVHGLGVVTVVTAQNSRQWLGATFMSAEFVGQQLEAVLSDYRVAAVKTGFLGRVDLIQLVADKLRAAAVPQVVIDPVMVDGDAAPMFGPEVLDAYRRYLLPQATIITPNRGETRLLVERPLPAPLIWDDIQPLLQDQLRPGQTLVAKGIGERTNGPYGDWVVTAEGADFVPLSFIDTPNTAGTGDTLSAALAARLALGHEPAVAIQGAERFTARAIAAAASWRLASGRGPIANFSPEPPIT